MAVTLILGGARSGKSRYAQQQAEAAPRSGRLVMIATAEAHDAEMAARIAQHRRDRGPSWTTVEAPRELAIEVNNLAAGDVAVIDCLTLWLNNVLMPPRADAKLAVADLVQSLEKCRAQVWVVSNEVGLGIVPDNELARTYRDIIGGLHQSIAAIAGHVVFIVAGLPLTVK